jgi:hypothetical protein
MLENHEVSESVALDEARRFNFITASRAMFKPYVGKMKQANSSLTLLVYLIGTHLRDVEIDGIPDDWFAKDANNHRITSPYDFYLMDPSNPEWVNFVKERCVEWRAYSGYDGCFLDTMGIAPTLPGYESALPINKVTGKPWTAPDWLKATTHIADEARKAVAPKLLLIQGTAQGDRYYSSANPTSQLLNGSDGSMIEMFLRTPEASVTKFPPEARWKQDVDMVADHGARGKYVLATTKLWSKATPEQYDQWHEYALGSFLLGFNGRGGAFVFLRGKLITDSPQIGALIGSPSTTTYARNAKGYYERSFANGKVFVNPTKTSYTISLGGSYKTLKGVTVTSITLAPNRGAVLVKA